MGLLGEGWDDPKSMATLQLAAGLLGGGNFGQALGRGLAGYQDVLQGATKEKVLKAQMANLESEAAARVQALDLAKRKAQALPGLYSGGGVSAGSVSAPELGGVPMFSQGVKVEQPSVAAPAGFNWQAALAAGYTPDEIQKLAGLTDLGRQEVARTVEADDGKGGKVTRQLDKFGRPVGGDIAAYLAPVQVNRGNRIDMVKPVAGASFEVGMSPSERDASARGWASNNLALKRFVFDQNQASKPQWKDGYWVVPPSASNPAGSVVETPFAAPAKGSPMANRQSAVKVIDLVDRADRLLDESTGSYVGTGLDKAAGAFGVSTGGAKAAAQLKALQASLMLSQPRMEGPQSDKDVAMYREAAGTIGDSTVPVETRRAALKIIRSLNEKYAPELAGGAAPAAAPGQLGSGSFGLNLSDINAELQRRAKGR